MRHVFLLAVGLFLAPCHGFAQEPSDCMAIETTLNTETGEESPERCNHYEEHPDYFLKEARLRTIGKQGSAGRTRSAYVLELLEDENWDVRAEAAKTLRLIGETSAIPNLVAAVSERDWKLTLEAITSLKAMKAGEADSVLAGVADIYWLPAIASAAGDLRAGRQLPVLGLSYDEIRNYCEVRADFSRLPRCHKSSETTEEQWRINDEHVGYGERFEQEFLANPALKDAKPLGRTLKVAAGEFTGTSNGEFGGELTFSDGTTRQSILKENIQAVIKIRGRILVVTGLNHMTTDEGYIFEVTKWSGQWKALRLWRLPGAPYRIVMAPDETLGIFGAFGSVLYGKDDALHWIACGPSYECRRY